MPEYTQFEGENSSVCITFDKTLEKSISVNYTLANIMVSGEPAWSVLVHSSPLYTLVFQLSMQLHSLCTIVLHNIH